MKDKYLIVSCADGAFNSYIACGLEEARRKVAEEYYYGTYEEAQKDRVCSEVLKEFDDQENCWHWDQKLATRWESKGEQCYLEVILIRTPPANSLEKSKELLDFVKNDCWCKSMPSPSYKETNLCWPCVIRNYLGEQESGVPDGK